MRARVRKLSHKHTDDVFSSRFTDFRKKGEVEHKTHTFPRNSDVWKSEK